MMRWLTLAALAGLAAGAGLLLLWLGQRRLIYIPLGGTPPPAASLLPGAVEVPFPTADGLTLAGWYVPPPGAAWGSVLICNGNAGHRGLRAPLAAALRREGLAVFLFDYRGYGGNPGSPSEAGLARDIRGARAALLAQPGVDAGRVAYLGESLGGAVALELALEHPPAALILRSPFTSLADVGRFHYPFLPVRWLLADRYPSLDRIPALRAPLLVVAGGGDGIVPLEQSRRLHQAAPEPRRLVILDGADHNDPVFIVEGRFTREVVAFLREALSPSPAEGSSR